MTAGKFTMIGINMSDMNEAGLTLDELFPYNTNMAAGTAAANGDQIRTWDFANQKYTYFFMYKNAFNAKDAKNGHWVENTTAKAIASLKIKTGDAVFYYAKSKANTFTVPGQVPAEAAGKLKQGFNMIGVGFPAEWNPNDAGADFWSSASFAKGTAAANADQIRYWDVANQKFVYYFLYKNAFNAKDPKNNKWVSNDTAKNVLDQKLTTGEGFFYYKKNAGEIDFKPGLSL